ncbi:tRNA-guanine family transglycosylase [Tumebacillus sp. BK434]|nr:tRNA-guanine family transglycosylase [Tumebacillus sp. BK434]
MDFYVGWSHSDAMYSDYFPGCPMLISAVPDNIRPLRRFKIKPKKLILDSGAVFYASHPERARVKDIFSRQLEILQDGAADTEVRLVHVDEPMLNMKQLRDRYKAMEKTIFNAYEYMNLFSSAQLPQQITPVGVIQGFDLASIRYSVLELKKIGYINFGIGSLLARRPQEQIAFITYAAELVGADKLHVFGVTGLKQIQKMVELGIQSFDSTRPTMAAAFFQIFYSNPFRTYLIDQSNVNKKITRIDYTLPCDCPICLERPDDLLIPTPRDYMKLRSIHNYYHLKKTIQQFQHEKERVTNAVPNVLRS